MNPFPYDLHFDNAGYLNGRRRIILTKRFRAVTSLGTIDVPAGFISDGGSIPRIAWSIVGDGFDDALEDFVIHDFLYSPLNDNYDRSEADFILKETLYNRGINPCRRQAFWIFVRAFGGRHFKAQIQNL